MPSSWSAGLDTPARLVISHAAGDEGREYEKRVRYYAERMDVPSPVCRRPHRAGARAPAGRAQGVHPRRYLSVCRPDHLPVGDRGLWQRFSRGGLTSAARLWSTPIRSTRWTSNPRGSQAIEFDGFITEECVRRGARGAGGRRLGAGDGRDQLSHRPPPFLFFDPAAPLPRADHRIVWDLSAIRQV